MTPDDMRDLAAHHERESTKFESAANYAAVHGHPQPATDARLMAEWHTNTAIHLRELAAAFDQLLAVLRS